MAGILKDKTTLLAALLASCLFFGFCLDASAQKKTSKKKKKAAQTTEDISNSAEPDKELYTRALDDLKHSRYTEGRLALQTLINTYPDSEYLAKAKLAVADSYFKEGGVSNLTQAISEYKDFRTFFPFLDEAAYAQMQIGMAHFRMMEKADRDNAQAQMAEDEFQTMLLNYPQSPLAADAAQRLREVQEILADGDFRVARYYYTKGDTHAAGARLIELTDRYPLYSQSDEALWMLGNIYIQTKQITKDEDLRNVWAGQAARCYARIARDYPLSRHANEAKARLKGMGMAVPAADPDAMLREQKEQQYAREHHSTFSNLLNPTKGMLKGAPDVSMAARSGQPNLNPPTDTISATEVLKPQSAGAKPEVAAGSTGAESGPTTQVDATSTGAAANSPTAGMQAGVQIITPQESGEAAPTAGTTAAPSASVTSSAAPSEPAAGSAPAASAPTAPAVDPAKPAAAASAPGAPSAAAPPAAAQPAAQGATPNQGQESSSQASTGTTPAAAPAGQPAAAQSTANGDDDKKESTSKKKKGLRKLVPW
jgi:outer membrane protein assembly factor BamD